MKKKSKLIVRHINSETFHKTAAMASSYAEVISAYLHSSGKPGEKRLAVMAARIIESIYENGDEELESYVTSLSYATIFDNPSLIQAINPCEGIPFCQSAMDILIGEIVILTELVKEVGVEFPELAGHHEYCFNAYGKWLVDAFDLASKVDGWLPEIKLQESEMPSRDIKTLISTYEEAIRRAEDAQIEYSRNCPVCAFLSSLKGERNMD